MKDDIQQAWQRYCNGDREALGFIYTQAHQRLTLYNLGVTRDEEQAKNIASDTLMKLIEYRPPEDIKNPMAWLFQVAKNTAYSWFTKKKRRDEIDADIESGRLNLAYNDGLTKIENDRIDDQVKHTLEPDEWAIWQLHTQGYANHEIATKLQVAQKSVANKKSKARNKLKQLFKRELNK